MVAVPGFAYFPVEFDKLGRPAAFGNAQVRALEAALGHDEPTDLIVISHGWNNDMAEAEALYQELLANMRGLLEGGKCPALRDRTFAVLGVLWPSKKFADQELIPGQAAGVGNTIALESVRSQLDDLRGAFDADTADESLTELQLLLPKLEDSDPAGRRFVELCRTLIRTKSADDEAQSESFFGLDSLDVYRRLQLPASFTSINTPAVEEEGGALGVGEPQSNAEGLGEFFSGSLSAARNILNYTTYYQMKERAGVVG
ncbi:MAG TPA: hypothetical protein VNY82_12480, partial [Steroidobacteraceae bacterium]|nr:hypothetical protein [Steroidobacteraceae bacterium]